MFKTYDKNNNLLIIEGLNLNYIKKYNKNIEEIRYSKSLIEIFEKNNVDNYIEAPFLVQEECRRIINNFGIPRRFNNISSSSSPSSFSYYYYKCFEMMIFGSEIKYNFCDDEMVLFNASLTRIPMGDNYQIEINYDGIEYINHMNAILI